MTKPLVQVGDEIREMTAAEYTQWQKDIENSNAQLELAANAAATRANALAKLEALGLTPAEIAALVG